MGKDIKIKNILLYVIIIILILYVTDIIIRPYEYINMSKLNNKVEKIHHLQQIAPSRVYINAWRIARNEYADKTMNKQKWQRWRNRYKGQIKTMEDADVAINTMLYSLNDPYTKFLKTNNFAKEKIILNSKITGIGLTYNKTDEGVVVNKILKNSPAQEGHIMPGDYIVSINDKKVNEMNNEEVHAYMEPEKNVKVKLKIKRGEEVIEKEIESKDIPIDTMKYEISEDNIGIIKLSNVMGEKAVRDFKTVIEETNGTKGIIIDLRNNYGGILANAIEMSDLMFNGKKIIDIESRGVTKYDVYAQGNKVFKDKPIVILINNRTASAAEILAGTLKENADAVLIGEVTYGKNSIQQIIPMSNKTGIMVTALKYILPNGDDIDNKGIEPDKKITYSLTADNNDNYIQEGKKIINRLVEKK